MASSLIARRLNASNNPRTLINSARRNNFTVQNAGKLERKNEIREGDILCWYPPSLIKDPHKKNQSKRLREKYPQELVVKSASNGAILLKGIDEGFSAGLFLRVRMFPKHDQGELFLDKTA